MTRQRRFKGLIISSFYTPIEHQEILEKSKELAKREDVPFSVVVNRALAEYLRIHYPGNPQVKLSLTDEALNEYLNERAKARLEMRLQWGERQRWFRDSASGREQYLSVLDEDLRFIRRLREPSREVEETLQTILRRVRDAQI